MPRGPRGRVPEKSKDFPKAIKKLFSQLKTWRFLMIMALGLALISAIIALVTPNILSDMTDVITEGIKPNVEVLKEVGEEISANISAEDIASKVGEVMKSEEISIADKALFNQKIAEMRTENNQEAFLEIPTSVLEVILSDIEVRGVKITVGNQIDYLKLMATVSKDTADSMVMLEKLEQLPKSIYDLVKPRIDMEEIRKIALILMSLYVISASFGYIQSFSMTTVSNNFAKSLRKRISKKINLLPLMYFDTHETGDVLSRITNDVDTIAMNMNNSLATLVSSTTLFIGSILMMFVTNYIMAITAILASLIGFIFMGLILSKSQKYFIKRQEGLGNMNGYIEEIYSGHNVVKVYNGVDEAKEEFNKLNKDLYHSIRMGAYLSGLMQPIMGFVGNLGYVAVCVVGALLTMNDFISFGVIVAFMIYVRLFTNPLSQIAQAMTNLQSTAAASERVFEFLEEVEMADESNLKKVLDKFKVKGEVEFKNVKFGYDKNRIIINDFSAKAKKGQKIAIVGPTGAGKTTMVNLLMKFYEINSGDILIDGVSIKDLTRDNIHELFIMVLQDTWLFDGTVRENIKFNKENVSDEEIWKALKTVGVDHFVKTLPGGLDAKLDDSNSVSSGQKQLLTIARGMIEDSPLLILDEATSNVDTRTEELVQKAMDKLMEGRTSFIIAHRLSTIKNADLILVMKDGNIIEQGNHKQLMKKNGFYAELYNSQFEL